MKRGGKKVSAIVNKIANLIGFDMEEEELAEDYQEIRDEKKDEKVVKFNDIKNKKAPRIYSQEVFEHVLLNLKAFDEATRIADEIKAKKMITFNLSELEFEIARRVLDFVSGVAYNADATLNKVSEHVFTAAPKNIKISNELPIKESGNELLNNKITGDEEEIVRGR